MTLCLFSGNAQMFNHCSVIVTTFTLLCMMMYY